VSIARDDIEVGIAEEDAVNIVDVVRMAVVAVVVDMIRVMVVAGRIIVTDVTTVGVRLIMKIVDTMEGAVDAMIVLIVSMNIVVTDVRADVVKLTIIDLIVTTIGSVVAIVESATKDEIAMKIVVVNALRRRAHVVDASMTMIDIVTTKRIEAHARNVPRKTAAVREETTKEIRERQRRNERQNRCQGNRKG
jgi:hypothetical protein